MLARQRSPVAHDQIRSLLDEGAIGGDAVRRAEVVRHAVVHAPVPEVSVQRTVVAVPVGQGAKVAEVASEAFHGHAGVLPPLPGVGPTGHADGGGQTRLPDLPHPSLLVRVDEQPHGGRGFGPPNRRHQVACPAGRLIPVRAAELGQEPPGALRQQRQVVRVQARGAHPVDHDLIESLQSDAAAGEHLGDRVGGGVDIGVPQHQQHPCRRALDQPYGRLEHRHAGALGADQRAGDVEAMLGEQRVQVVARNPAWDVRKAFADPVGVPVAEVAEAGVDGAPAAPLRHDAVQVGVRRRADGHARAVVRQDVERHDVRVGLPGHDRVHAAGVVPDHAAQRAPPVRRGIGPERQTVRLRRGAELVEDDPRFDACRVRVGVDLHDAPKVLRAVQHHRHVAALAGEARPAAAGQDRRVVGAAHVDRGHEVLDVSRHHDPDGHVPVIGSVRRVQGAVAGREEDLTAEGGPEVGLQPPRGAGRMVDGPSLSAGPIDVPLRARRTPGPALATG